MVGGGGSKGTGSLVDSQLMGVGWGVWGGGGALAVDGSLIM